MQSVSDLSSFGMLDNQSQNVENILAISKDLYLRLAKTQVISIDNDEVIGSD